MFTSQAYLVVSEVMTQEENFDTGGEDVNLTGVKWTDLRRRVSRVKNIIYCTLAVQTFSDKTENFHPLCQISYIQYE